MNKPIKKENFYNVTPTNKLLPISIPDWIWIVIFIIISIITILIFLIIWGCLKNNKKPKYGFKFY